MAAESSSPFLMALLQQQEFIGLLGLGKLADPSTGEAKVDLDKTRYAIGMLEMLELKTTGNLSEAEGRQLRQVLTSLRLNFVEEAQRASSAAAPEAAAEGQASGTPGAAEGPGDRPASSQAEE